jgi:hypothetical protein
LSTPAATLRRRSSERSHSVACLSLALTLVSHESGARHFRRVRLFRRQHPRARLGAPTPRVKTVPTIASDTLIPIVALPLSRLSAGRIPRRRFYRGDACSSGLCDFARYLRRGREAGRLLRDSKRIRYFVKGEPVSPNLVPFVHGHAAGVKQVADTLGLPSQNVL